MKTCGTCSAALTKSMSSRGRRVRRQPKPHRWTCSSRPWLGGKTSASQNKTTSLNSDLEDPLLAILIIGRQMSSRALVQPALGYVIRERPEAQDGKGDCPTFTGREDIYEVAAAAPALELLN